MGQFQKVRDEDHDDEECNALVQGDDDEAAEIDHGLEHWQPQPGLCLGCLTPRETLLFFVALSGFLLLSLAALSAAADAIARRAVTRVATSAFGADASVGGVAINILGGTSTIWDLRVKNPLDFSQGRGTDFLVLGEGSTELRWDALFSDFWLLREIRLAGLEIRIEQNPDFSSNAAEVSARLQAVSTWTPPGSDPLPGEDLGLDPQSPLGFEAERRGLFAANSRIVADLLTMTHVGILMCSRPACDSTGPKAFAIERIEVRGIGRGAGGVHLHQLLHIILQASLIGATQAIPGPVGADLKRSLARSLSAALDFGSIRCDFGSGLTQIFDWGLQREVSGAVPLIAPRGVAAEVPDAPNQDVQQRT
mmetsp:Transcript_28157/g.80953  ORF Transcript_28157/g.80953 Transcript_28157/m.80953 type:complete len:365 (+) Transcript_28157:64-1158(+)